MLLTVFILSVFVFYPQKCRAKGNTTSDSSAAKVPVIKENKGLSLLVVKEGHLVVCKSCRFDEIRVVASRHTHSVICIKIRGNNTFISATRVIGNKYFTSDSIRSKLWLVFSGVKLEFKIVI